MVCGLCVERLNPARTDDPERLVCEACLRDYQRQVRDRSPELRRVALELFEAHTLACRTSISDTVIRQQNATVWALYRLGVDIPRRRFLSIEVTSYTRTIMKARVQIGYNDDRRLELALALFLMERLDPTDPLRARLVEQGHGVASPTFVEMDLAAWSLVVEFATAWSLAIVLPYVGREPLYLTDHLVDGLPDFTPLFTSKRSAELVEERSATYALRLTVGDRPLTGAELGLLLSGSDAASFVDGDLVIVSKFSQPDGPDFWLTPLRELSTCLRDLGFSLVTLPRRGLTDLRPEPKQSTDNLRLGLAQLGLVDTGQKHLAWIGHSVAHDCGLNIVCEQGTGDLLVELGARAHRLSGRSPVAAQLAAVRALL